ncbi:uncharacterized protein LOC120253931 [Dioscorea cayenensis subsp. rotundata]|uniref:Uncharacterized protein LOC120253931 n=1 Tax=Dioscorea cayennensis subsp. rotundata TaxID=55577 RepID=A0AB40AST3_DIOCR|nr:uncharacterized protein LOC120253931 [Dioscorea cayenensis subsp. rotundata]
MFKTLHINVPFIEALAQLPHYAMFLKEWLLNKRKIKEVSIVTLSEEYSTIISNRIPKKEKDLGEFIIPCTIEGMLDEKALADLGASISLMTYKIFQKLGLCELKPTRMTLQLANCYVHHPMGVVEVVLVKMD